MLKLHMTWLVSFESGYLGCKSTFPPKFDVAINQSMGPHHSYSCVPPSFDMWKILNNQGIIYVASVGNNLNLFQKCLICDRTTLLMLPII